MPNSYRGSRSRSSTIYRYGRSNTRGQGRRVKQHIDPKKFIKKASVAIADHHPIKHRFSDFALDRRLLENIAKAGFDSPLPIQDQTISSAIEGRDIIGLANTGTGKTAAFLIPIINSQLKQRHVTLVMAPTRELAIQIDSDFKILAKQLNMYSALCVGGQPLWKQRHALESRPQFVIGTPGRLKDLVTRRLLKLEHCRSLVLDEVDRMVDMGFINDIKSILSQLPTERQSYFFTATAPPKIESVMQQFLSNPIKVSVANDNTSDNVEQDVVRLVPGENKLDKLHEILSHESTAKALVFGETKYGVEKINTALSQRGHNTVSIHGNKSQSQRQRALLAFRSGNARVMVATDVAARGLDIKEITHVINYDTPQTYDDYIHRVGRAGRAGNKGYALTFLDHA